MKIVHIALCGPVTDGWNYQDNMIPMYNAMDGHEVTMITSRSIFTDKGNIDNFEKTGYFYSGVKIIRLELILGKNAFSKIKIYKNLYKTIEEEAPEIIFIHNISFLDIYQIRKYAMNHKVTIFADNHNDFSNSGKNFFSKNILHGMLWRHMAQMIDPYVKKFYGVLPARVDFLINIYSIPKDKVELLVMGVDDRELTKVVETNAKRRIRKKYNIKDTDFLIMTGGKIDSFKWQTLLLMEAVKKLDNRNVKLIVFGSVSSDLMERVNKLSDGSKIQYIGWVESKESYDYFSAADLVVFPGRHSVFWEEVAGMGIPMICKYWDGTTHVDCGGNIKFLYRDDETEIRDIIKTLIFSEEYYSMKTKAQDSMAQFSYKEISRKAIEIENK